MTPGKSDKIDALMTFVEGDTWEGMSVTITPLVESGLASVRLHIKTDDNATRASLKLSSDDASQILITDNSTTSWAISIRMQQLNLKKGSYVWQLEFTDADGDVWSYLEGKMTVLTDLTR